MYIKFSCKRSFVRYVYVHCCKQFSMYRTHTSTCMQNRWWYFDCYVYWFETMHSWGLIIWHMFRWRLPSAGMWGRGLVQICQSFGQSCYLHFQCTRLWWTECTVKRQGYVEKWGIYRVNRNDCRGFNNLPSRFPDVTPCDLFLWGYVKDQVYELEVLFY
jgi:hypothetical protein